MPIKTIPELVAFLDELEGATGAGAMSDELRGALFSAGRRSRPAPRAPRLPDPAYVAEREALVPLAEAVADATWGHAEPPRPAERERWARAWNLDFHAEMSRLWEERATGVAL